VNTGVLWQLETFAPFLSQSLCAGKKRGGRQTFQDIGGRDENCGIIPSNMKTKLKVSAVALMTGAALGCVTGLSLSCTRQRESALKPIDKSALQTMVARTAKELLIPGALVLLRTPQGEFTVTYGTTLLGATSPPDADTHFRIASNTKTMTAAVIVQLAEEGQLDALHWTLDGRATDLAVARVGGIHSGN